MCHNLHWSAGKNEEFDFDREHARYFLSVLDIKATQGHGPGRWRKRFFVLLSRNAGSRVEAFGLPANHRDPRRHPAHTGAIRLVIVADSPARSPLRRNARVPGRGRPRTSGLPAAGWLTRVNTPTVASSVAPCDRRADHCTELLRRSPRRLTTPRERSHFPMST